MISITLSGIYLYFLKDVAFEAMGVASDPNNPFANEEFMKNIFNFTADYQALFTVANIPVYGFISWLVFLNKKKYNFYEHLIIYIYTASQTAVLSFLIVVPFYFIDRKLSGLLTVIMSALTIVYFAYVLIRLFKLTFFSL